MPVFTFYFLKEDGSAISFEAFEHASDDDALDHGEVLLSQHTTCAYVAVWQGDQRILARLRRPTGAAARCAEIEAAS